MTDHDEAPQDGDDSGEPAGTPSESAADHGPTPAGWYPDGTGNQRWWDGQQWADHVAPMAPATSNTDPKTIASLMHVSGIFFGFIGPLVGYLVYPQDPFIREHSRSALNFQLTLLLGYLASFVLAIVLIGFLMIFILIIVSLVFHIMAAVESSKGNQYSYPMTIEFIKS